MDTSNDQPIPLPLHHQLKTLLLEEILSGRYGSDGRLPTEHELCARFGISRTPVTRALSQLAEEGVVLRHRRRGTFVNPHWLRRQADGAELRVLCPEGGPWEDHLRQVAGPEIRLSFASVPLEELHSVFVHAVAEGRGPDLAVLDSVWMSEFARTGFLTPLAELDEAWVVNEYTHDFLPPFVDAYDLAPSTVAVQAEADVAGLWYRRAALVEVGLEPPRTWSELRGTCRRLAERRRGVGYPLAIHGGSRADETTTYALLTFLASNGGKVLDAGQVTLHSTETVEALRFLRRLLDDGIMPLEVLTYESGRTARLLAQGQADLCLAGSYEARFLADAAGVSMDDVTAHFGFTPMPAGPRGTQTVLGGGMVYCVPRQAHQPQLAMRLLETAVAPTALARMCRLTGQIPPRRSAVELVAADSPFLADTAAMLEKAVVRPSTPSYTLVSAQLQAMLEGLLARRYGPGAAAARTAEMISAITGLPIANR